MSAPVSDRMSASTAMSPFIWRFVRPSARRSPFSRVRSATDSDSVLATPTRDTRTDTPRRPTRTSISRSIIVMYILRSRALPDTSREASLSNADWTVSGSDPSTILIMTA